MYDNVNRRVSLLEGDVDSYNFGKGGAELLFGCIPPDEHDPSGSSPPRRTGRAAGKPHAAGRRAPPPLQPVRRPGELRVQ